MEEHLKGLNAMQREAAIHMNGPILIVAGAGAGKTKTITHRILNLIKNGISPDKILAVTFTNKAAKEMRERIISEIKKHIKGQDSVPFVSTFHSLGVYIIKENAHILGLTRHFTILDDSDSTTLIKESLKELGIDPKQYDPRKIKNIISREKGKFTHLKDYEEKVYDYLSKLVAQVWALYEKKKAKENSLDFDDLLLKATKLLKEKEEIRKIYQEKWEYIHIDEYQDTNEVQYLMSRLLSEKNKNICVVGDADQNIYSWRGANLKNILSFEKDYGKETKIILLEENYRSTQNILEAANEVIKKNVYRPDKNLFTKNKTGEKIGLYEALDENDEADFVATKILELLDKITDVPLKGVSQADEPRGSARSTDLDSDPSKVASIILSDVAILYRANFQSRALEEALLRYNIPYQVLGVKFFERKEIKDTLAYLRCALNPESLSEIKRIINFPVRGIGKVTLIKLFSGEKENLPIKVKIKIDNFYKILEEIKEKIKSSKASEVIRFAVKKSGIETELSTGTEEDMERLENIKELVTLALKYDNSKDGLGIEKLLEDASLASDQDSMMIAENKKTETNAVKLMTVHASKGLEFKYIFTTGLEDGLFPHRRNNESKNGEDKEEERRLFYVAITRAREKLFLSFANFRTIFGSRQINAPSEFISDIPSDILEKEGEEGGIKTIYI
ncbi:MAG: protein PcrA [Candidatus Nomurabacteria bacterium GW2011_GWE1_32_28]|uniref:DNA 3'-5' helicase n=1 Tax=Candidatus Nomurabacteria bacterium GW2011_GWF1_31_48 TaxID=1618767 RepID=A0A0F9YV90_9BACT|nr:MAG: protein PcrA [Candidatus Nomurabacteria bacterium GW2011_GWF2_30_133]KKP28808.1 MAG: protein PcrA [Candidatus Nomurabacteria bacterium GW2011_GWE2_31_40]KKP30386.1 MAG: protein PcrA [Candidatus Nomurabacteria bacterium GW2011_GWF1_31_48]KKP34913.1 MAG: protein PcrA [Candidatus Nomurabacteria bacterium GW2011_GWE1_32_28]HAS81004.1 ATP-dependent DNA helicase PcrA [Candidatus Nomurabacteria bacterium]